MRRKLRFGCLTIVALLVVALGALAALNAREASMRDNQLTEATLTQENKAALAQARFVQTLLGDEVWPGFGSADLPVILFNDRFEFLVGASQPPPPWVVVEGDDFLGQAYQRREAERPQAFAVPVGRLYAGSIGALDRMNRQYLLGVREQLPPILAQLFPYQWATVSPDLHTVVTLHEVFHAHQATSNPDRFRQAEGVYAVEERYPYDDASFAAAWDREGALLAAALKEDDVEAARDLAREFLAVRSTRRAQAGLAEELIAFERELEWLEGLAKHVEIRFHELAAARADTLELTNFQPGLQHWQMEFSRLESQLGRQRGDFRFYLSGMAQARLLDRLLPGWQSEALRDGIHLEALLLTATSDVR